MAAQSKILPRLGSLLPDPRAEVAYVELLDVPPAVELQELSVVVLLEPDHGPGVAPGVGAGRVLARTDHVVFNLVLTD